MTAQQMKHTSEFVRRKGTILAFAETRVREIKAEKEQQFSGSVTLENMYSFRDDDTTNWLALVKISTKLTKTLNFRLDTGVDVIVVPDWYLNNAAVQKYAPCYFFIKKKKKRKS